MKPLYPHTARAIIDYLNRTGEEAVYHNRMKIIVTREHCEKTLRQTLPTNAQPA